MQMDDLLALLQQADEQRLSDIYLLPKADGYEVLLRFPTHLAKGQHLSQETGQRWLNFLKYQAGMNVAERRRVQLGALVLPQVAGYIRLSSVGDFSGRETLVLRLIHALPPVDAYTRPVVTRLLSALTQRGMLALCGATGTGKTTLLYQVATELAAESMVMTIEDPVEIIQPDFLQLQVNPAADMNYVDLLKAALRHRPDVLVIGEIRDLQTAITACEAAISGHLVLTTVHAKSAALVPLRLKALGVSPALVDAALVASAQVTLRDQPVIHPEVELITWPQ